MSMAEVPVPSVIYAKPHGSAASLITLEAIEAENDTDSSTPLVLPLRPKFGRMDSVGDCSEPEAPPIPRRKSSKGNIFRRINSSLSRSSEQKKDPTANAKFDLTKMHKRGASPLDKSGNPKPSLLDRFGVITGNIVSPNPSVASSSKMTRTSLSSSDTPLTMPRRKKSQQSFSLSSASRKSSGSLRKKFSSRNMLSMDRINERSCQNAEFNCSKQKNDSFNNTPTSKRDGKRSVKRYFTNSPLRI